MKLNAHLVVLAGLLMGDAVGEEVKLPVIADNSIAAFDSERNNNAGQAPRLKLKGLENIILLALDVTRLKGSVVDHAVLHIRGCDANLMVRKVGLSTVASAWSEGAGEDTPGKAGDSCFLSPAIGGERGWAQPGSCFLDAIWGHGGTIWTQVLVAPGKDQWYAIEVDGRLLEACATGLSSGLALSDDNGQTMSGHKDVVPDTNYSNNHFFAREQGNSAPYVLASISPVVAVSPAELEVKVQPWTGGADLQSGALEIVWPGPADEAARKRIIGYRMRAAIAGGAIEELPRWMHPTVVPAGEGVRALLRLQPSAAAVEAEVEVVGRGGVVLAKGRGKGRTSAAFPPPRALLPEPLVATAAGAPPSDANGSVWAVPDLAKVNPITGNAQEEAEVDYEGETKGAYRQANPLWSGAQRTISVSALRNEWVAFQLVCQNQHESAAWTIAPSALTGPGGATLPASAVRLSRLWYQKTGKGARGWYADPMLPLASGERFRIPDARNAVPGQTNQTIYAELFVPKDAKPGAYSGAIEIAVDDGKPLRVGVEIAVGAAAIPDQAAFRFSMNAYSSPGEAYGEADSEAFLAAERSFYVMSHEHRTTLAVLGYGHSARFQAGIAWPLTGRGKDMKVGDWSAWDKRFGPLFDGSAFNGTTRAGVAYDHFYLPFMESWPTPMAVGYQWNNVVWEEHWKIAGPVEEGFNQLYQDQWVAVMRDFEQHVKEKRWTTTFQVYLNDKYFYKQYDATRKRRGEGTSFWLLDEPQHIDDFSALAFFGKLIRQGQQGDRTSVVFRADISRPQWGRDLLDRVIDLNVSGGFTEFRPWLEDWRERYGQGVWTYGGAPPSTESAASIEMQALDLYARGVDGFVPWLTLGGEQNWTAFEDTCVFYTGKPMGITGACASLRLKAYRRGEQDVEYVRLLADHLGLLASDPNRRQVAALIGGAIVATRKRGTLDAQGAVTESLGGLHIEDFERLRRAIVARLK